jgi:hypothetical protein
MDAKRQLARYEEGTISEAGWVPFDSKISALSFWVGGSKIFLFPAI